MRPDYNEELGRVFPRRLPDDCKGNERIERSAAFPTTEYCGTNILDTGLEYSSRGAGFCTSKKCTFIFCSCWYACCGRFSAGTLIMNTKGFLWDEI